MRRLREYLHEIPELAVPRIFSADDGDEDEDEAKDADEGEEEEHRHDQADEEEDEEEEEEEEEEPVLTAPAIVTAVLPRNCVD
jgi:hypothetical protein